MWREEHLWNVSVLQEYMFTILIFLLFFIFFSPFYLFFFLMSSIIARATYASVTFTYVYDVESLLYQITRETIS
jgi:hypothetical protein